MDSHLATTTDPNKVLGDHPINRLVQSPMAASGPKVERKRGCDFCGSSTGYKVAPGEYWDLWKFDFVRCDQCELIQLDPPIPQESMDLGCQAYFINESNRESMKALNKKRMKSFRRGYHFGLKLKKLKINPQSVLEIGPGDGFFSIGLKQVFPNTQFCCVDVVPQVVERLEKEYGFKGYVSNVENMEINEKFDLIIARDIIEHVTIPKNVIQKISSLLNPSGHFHFITPNGFEDIWPAYCCWKMKQQPFELLLNHVNYFPPSTLKKQLESAGFKSLQYYIYDFNGTRWGRARKFKEKLQGPSAQSRSAEKAISTQKDLKNFNLLDEPQNKKWTQIPLLMRIYCFFKEDFRLRLPADLGIGHEIYGLFKKTT